MPMFLWSYLFRALMSISSSSALPDDLDLCLSFDYVNAVAVCVLELHHLGTDESEASGVQAAALWAGYFGSFCLAIKRMRGNDFAAMRAVNWMVHFFVAPFGCSKPVQRKEGFASEITWPKRVQFPSPT
jgi:hypothetical protein